MTTPAIFEQGSLRYELLSPKRRDRTTSILSMSFLNEPASSSLKPPPTLLNWGELLKKPPLRRPRQLASGRLLTHFLQRSSSIRS
jgi:hypothetical protein